MTAADARRISADALHRGNPDRHLDRVLRRIDEAARNGNCELAFPFTSIDPAPPDVRDQVLAELRRRGFRVRHVTGEHYTDQREYHYEVVAW